MSFLGILGRKEVKEVDEIGIKKPKVLIGVAGFHGVMPECQENFFQFAYRLGRDNPDFDFFLKLVIKREQFRARNNLVDLALINDCEYLLMLDDDMVVPPDLFSRLVAHDKDIIGALYYQRGGGFHPVIMRQAEKKDGLKGIDFIHHFDKMLTKPGLYEADIIGGGCMLMKTDIFRKIPQPYFWIDGIVGTDVHLCNQLREAGVKIYVDTSIELGHQGEGEIITSRTIPKYSRAIGLENESLWNDLMAHYVMNDIQLESEMIKACSGNAREEEWNKVPRETWESVRDYYTQGGDWQVLNMAAYNLKYDQARDWAINDITKTVKPGATVVDLGCGIGYTSIAIAERNDMKVICMDIEGTPTLDFLRWRVLRHKLQDKIEIIGFENPIPDDLKEQADLIFMISVFDHLWDPKGMLEWVTRNTKHNGYLLCDTWRALKKKGEPQHIMKYDPHRVIHDFRKLGWRECPENPFLFRKEF